MSFYLCPLCRRKTYHPKDVEHSYCPCCGSADLPKNCEHVDSPARQLSRVEHGE